MSPSTYMTTAALTSFLLAVLTTSYGHVNADTPLRQHCPILCLCESRHVKCITTDMTNVPQLSANTETIWFNTNKFTRIRANAFSNLHKLTEMTIRDNNIRSIDERAFDGLGLLRKLTLQEDLLESFESGVFRFFSNVTILSMRVNQMDVPHGEICTLKQLQQLKLEKFRFPSSSSVNKFDRCFEGLTKLSMLTLSGMTQNRLYRATFHTFRDSLVELHINDCKLRTLDTDTFKDLSKLAVLSLSNNGITHLPDTIFTPLTRLSQLDIGGNQLNAISDDLLRPLWYLEYLFIEHNPHLKLSFGEQFLNMTRLRQIKFTGRLPSLNNDTFRYLCHSPIANIDLTRFSIQKISKDAFQPLHSLTSLTLCNNPLTVSALHDAFYGLQRSPLRTLDLSGVDLSDYSTTLFEGLDDNKITKLVLENSDITIIKSGMFRNLGRLSELSLSNNRITTLENNSFKDLPLLSTLDINR